MICPWLFSVVVVRGIRKHKVIWLELLQSNEQYASVPVWVTQSIVCMFPNSISIIAHDAPTAIHHSAKTPPLTQQIPTPTLTTTSSSNHHFSRHIAPPLTMASGYGLNGGTYSISFQSQAQPGFLRSHHSPDRTNTWNRNTALDHNHLIAAQSRDGS